MDPLNYSQATGTLSNFFHRDQVNAGLRQPGALDFHELLTGSSRKLENNAAEMPEQLLTNPAPQQMAAPPVAEREYTVHPGDTLSEIVAEQLRHNGISHSPGELYDLVSLVAADNNLTNPDRIFPGQRLSTDLLPAFSTDNRLADEGRKTAASSVTAKAGPLTGSMSENRGPVNEWGLQPPAIGRIFSDFGFRSHPIMGQNQQHEGIDIGLPNGTPIKAIAGGTVTYAGENGSYGLTVDIDHGDGLSSRYAHLGELRVSNGELISPERVIARSGQSGLASGAHLHLEIHQEKLPINPLELLSRTEIEGENLTGEGNDEYTVRHGDTMSDIVARELRRRGLEYSRQEIYDTVRQLATANGLSNPDRIFAGQRLNLSTLEARAIQTATDEVA